MLTYVDYRILTFDIFVLNFVYLMHSIIFNHSQSSDPRNPPIKPGMLLFLFWNRRRVRMGVITTSGLGSPEKGGLSDADSLSPPANRHVSHVWDEKIPNYFFILSWKSHSWNPVLWVFGGNPSLINIQQKSMVSSDLSWKMKAWG